MMSLSAGGAEDVGRCIASQKKKEPSLLLLSLTGMYPEYISVKTIIRRDGGVKLSMKFVIVPSWLPNCSSRVTAKS